MNEDDVNLSNMHCQNDEFNLLPHHHGCNSQHIRYIAMGGYYQ